MLRLLPLAAALLLLAGPAWATPFTLTLDPGQSSLEVRDDFTGDPVLGPVSLSGTITFDVSGLPSGSFSVTQLDATGAGGIILANGSGSGTFGGGVLLFSTPFYTDVTVPGWVAGSNLGFPAPIGLLTPNGGDSAIASADILGAEFQLDASHTLVLQLYAVPEPTGLLGLGLLCVALRARRRDPAP